MTAEEPVVLSAHDSVLNSLIAGAWHSAMSHYGDSPEQLAHEVQTLVVQAYAAGITTGHDGVAADHQEGP